jgi:molybdenum cofactor cytidylyltransferase
MSTIAIIIVAAGNSSRLGQPKQLIPINGISMLYSVAKIATRISKQVMCIVGFNAEKHTEELKSLAIDCLVNPNWQQGMGSSIACGIKNLADDTDSVMILLCDQWAVTTQDLNKLVVQWKKQPEKIIASCYSDLKTKKKIIGVPAIFPQHYFSQLSQLEKTGARKIILNNLENVMPIKLENASFDLDTKEDLSLLNNAYLCSGQ